MTLDPSESINNMGSLRIDVMDATNLPAADRNGYSDPYCKFNLNDKVVHKTATQKKTLHPVWNESFEISIPSRTAAKLKVECWDWDLSDKDDFLGSADVNLSALEPFAPKEIVLGLNGTSGSVRLKILFRPDYITRSRQGTSTFHGTFATPVKVIGAPVRGVSKVGSFVGNTFKRKKTAAEEEVTTSASLRPASGQVTEAASRPSGAASTPTTSSTHLPYTPRVISETQRPSTPSETRQLSYIQDPTSATTNGRSSNPDAGTATISLLSASNFEGSNLRVYVRQKTHKGGIKDIHKSRALKVSKGGEAIWDEHIETFRVACMSDAQFSVHVKDTHTFGADNDLGEGTFSVADAASALGAAAGSGTRKVVHCGQGTVTVRTSFMQGETPAVQAGSPAGHLRKSLLQGRSPRDKASASNMTQVTTAEGKE